MRINRYLADSGVCSRRQADKLIEEKRVKINGKHAAIGAEVADNDTVTLDGAPVKRVHKYTYLLLNKPKGCISSVSDEFNRKTVMDYIDIKDKRLFPVGRLDYDSEGMLIITDDGELANRLTHPANEIYKTYIVKTQGLPSEEDLNRLRRGVIIDGKKTNRSYIKLLESDDNGSRLEVKISEGRNHQIKKMFEAIGREVKFLKRVAIGDLRLGGLMRGEYRRLKDEEVYYLKNL
jgi:23S rRNA pseudouridine2605 synthase